MTQSRRPSIDQLLRSSHETSGGFDKPDFQLEQDVSSTIQLIENTSQIVNDLLARLNAVEQSMADCYDELIELRAYRDDAAERLAVAEDAIRAHADRADRAERLLSAAQDKASRATQRNAGLMAQIERLMDSATKSLSVAASAAFPSDQPGELQTAA